MNSADWFRKNLKGRVQQTLGSKARAPRLRRVALRLLDRITRGSDNEKLYPQEPDPPDPRASSDDEQPRRVP